MRFFFAYLSLFFILLTACQRQQESCISTRDYTIITHTLPITTNTFNGISGIYKNHLIIKNQAGYIPINISTNTVNDTLKTLINFYEFNKLQCYSDSLIGYKDDNNIEQSIKVKYVFKNDNWQKQIEQTNSTLEKTIY